MTSVTFNSAHRIHLDSEFFIARRPVLDGKRRLAAHEFLFCHPADADPGLLDMPASASLLADVENHGLLRIVGEVPAYLRMDAEAVLSEAMIGLPVADTVMVLPREAALEASLPERLARLRALGYRFALDLGMAAGLDQAARTLLPLVESVHFSAGGKTEDELRTICAAVHANSKNIVAEDIDTETRFKQCQALGCSLFSGRFFLEASPGIREISPSQRAITQLIGLVAADASTAEIEAKIKTDPVLSLNLINLVNTPALSVHRVESLHQVLMILGRSQLQRWLQLLLFSKSAQKENTHPTLPLLLLAAGRARLMELVAQTLHAGSRNIADTAFTVGIMSLMDRLFGISMPDLLDQMLVVDEVRAALQQREGPYGELLWLAELCEWQMEGNATLNQLQSLLKKLHLSHHMLYGLQLDAFEWSDEIGCSIG